MSPADKPLVWLHGQVRSPPLSREARLEAGYLLRQLQRGLDLAMPHSRPMPSIARNVHELRVNDRDGSWRIVFRLDPDAVVILEVFAKTSRTTPRAVIRACRKRLTAYDAL